MKVPAILLATLATFAIASPTTTVSLPPLCYDDADCSDGYYCSDPPNGISTL